MTNKVPIDRIWAGTTDVVPPEATRIASGYIAGDGSPDASFSNFVQKRQDQYMKHLDERGMTEWSLHILYKKGAFVWYDGNAYNALVATQGAYPSGSPTIWTTLAQSVDNPLTDIKAWSGPVTSIPAGWLLCNGTNGTVNLSDRFIQSANPAGSNLNTTGGTGAKTTTASGSHTHVAYSGGGSDGTAATGPGGGHTHTLAASGDHTHPGVVTGSHTLSAGQLPSHTHTIAARSGGNTASGSGQYLDRTGYTTYTGSSDSHEHGLTTSAQGTHNHTGSTDAKDNHTHELPASSGHSHTMGTQGSHTHTFPAVDPEHYILCFITRSPT